MYKMEVIFKKFFCIAIKALLSTAIRIWGVFRIQKVSMYFGNKFSLTTREQRIHKLVSKTFFEIIWHRIYMHRIPSFTMYFGKDDERHKVTHLHYTGNSAELLTPGFQWVLLYHTLVVPGWKMMPWVSWSV